MESKEKAPPPPPPVRRHYPVVLTVVLFISLVLLTVMLVKPFDAPQVSEVGPKSSHHHHHHHHHHDQHKKKTNTNKRVILISMDGFRHDYLEKARAMGVRVDNFDYLISHGVRAMQVKNVFPSITLPNHHSIVTGLYPESHGIVLNTFIDPTFPGETFNMDNQTTLNEDSWFRNWPEPIWVTLQRHGILTASQLWPITDAPIKNDLPFQQVSQFTLLDGLPARYPYKKRVDDLLWWLTNPRYTIGFVMLYFDEPDETGHAYGPNSKQVIAKVKELDGYVGYMIQRLKAAKLFDEVDIIMTADHGMAELNTARYIYIDTLVSPKLYTDTLLTPISTIYPNKGQEEVVYNKLKGAHPHFEVYRKKDVPEEFHYSSGIRIAPIVAIADLGWSVVHGQPPKPTPGKVAGGNHGYNNSFPDMHPFMIAHGPSFKVNYTTPLAHMVDIYPLMCHLMGIPANPNNGSLARITHILNSKMDQDCLGKLLNYLLIEESTLEMVGIAAFFCILLYCCIILLGFSHTH